MPNCSQIGRSSPSLCRIPSMAAGVASSPAITAAGSPGVRCSRRKTKSATTTITGMVASRRLRMYAVTGWKSDRTESRPSLLVDIPHGRYRGRDDHSGDPVGAIGDGIAPLRERDVGHLVVGAPRQVHRDLLARRLIRRERPLLAQV